MTTTTERAKDISLGLLGAAEMPIGMLSDNVTWQNGDRVLIGHAAVLASVGDSPPLSVTIDDVVTHGKAAAVSGRLVADTGPRLFCHMIKFTNSSAKKIASIVSFQHQIKDCA